MTRPKQLEIESQFSEELFKKCLAGIEKLGYRRPLYIIPQRARYDNVRIVQDVPGTETSLHDEVRHSKDEGSCESLDRVAGQEPKAPV